MSLADELRAEKIGSRRTYILRLLVDAEGEVNESIVLKHAQQAFPTASREDLRGDLDHLVSVGCMKDDWIDVGAKSIRSLSITERGEDAAHGRLDVPGVWRSRWER